MIRLTEIEDAPVRLDRSVELPELLAGNGEPLVPGGVRLSGEIRRGSAGVEMRARWEAVVRQPCCRCLEPFELEHKEEFFLVLTPEAREFGAHEQEMQPDDASLFYVEEDRVDLAQIVTEQVLLAQPLKPVCREDCVGLCQTCGVNRNRIKCGCRRDEVDPRLAPLLDIKERFGEG